MKYKTGPLSKRELAWLTAQAPHVGVKVAANYLNRSADSVEKACIRFKIPIKEIVVKPISSDPEREAFILAELQSETFWRELQKQLTADELSFLSHQYVEYIMLFEKTAPVVIAEKMALKQLLVTEILFNRVMQSQKRYFDISNNLSFQIDNEKRKLNPNISDLNKWEAEKQNCEALFSTFSQDMKELQNRMMAMRKELSISRQQRTENLKETNTSFGGFIVALEDESLREREGQQINIFRAAVEKERKRLADYHTYMDGELDVPLFNADIVDMLKQRESK